MRSRQLISLKKTIFPGNQSFITDQKINALVTQSPERLFRSIDNRLSMYVEAGIDKTGNACQLLELNKDIII